MNASIEKTTKNGKQVFISEVKFGVDGRTTYTVTQTAPGFFHEDTGFSSLNEAKNWVKYGI